MKEFTRLLSPQGPPNPGEQQRHLSARLAEALRASRLNLWNIGDAVASVGRRALIGIAPYSMYDLKLLEALNELSLDTTSDKIDVFDVLKCPTQDDIAKYIPSIGKVYQTPISGVWRNCNLEEKRWGYDACERIMELYGIEKNKLM